MDNSIIVRNSQRFRGHRLTLQEHLSWITEATIVKYDTLYFQFGWAMASEFTAGQVDFVIATYAREEPSNERRPWRALGHILHCEEVVSYVSGIPEDTPENDVDEPQNTVRVRHTLVSRPSADRHEYRAVLIWVSAR